jgi:protein-S-isoprenylcysteine O-methyltransferase Ste14
MDAELRRGVVRRVAQLLVQRLVESLVLFASAGTLCFVGGWLYVGTVLVMLVAMGIFVLPRCPEVVAERGKTHEGTAGFDKVLLILYGVAYVAQLVVGALDAGRYHWAPLGLGWSFAGAGLLFAGMIPVAGAMLANRNLETTVRIQSDRGHAVAKTGPYAWVRHPMYAGLILIAPGTALVLGSTWSLVPSAVAVVVLVVRTGLEDRKLRADLEGYEAYSRETRWRLLPGVW